MKTILNEKTGEVKRVSDEDARKLVNAKRSVWKYCPKSLWKKADKMA